jgi:hypothetical protein
MKNLVIYCADVGSVRTGSFAWARDPAIPAELESREQTSIDDLCFSVAHDLNAGRAVALGFEAPLFVPVPVSSTDLGRARDGEGNRAWSAGAGAGVLATGLAQTAWVLRNLREACPTQALSATWDGFSQAGEGLLIWEAFVSGNAKPTSEAETSHKADAAAAVTAFRDSLPNPPERSVITTSDPFSLIGAAAIWSGWISDLSFLHEASVAIRPSGNTDTESS